jgi:arylsulfatase A-like enzyme
MAAREGQGSINRREFVGALGGAAAVISASCTSAPPSETADPSRPNIIYIVADDMGYGDLSGYGRPDVRTVALDHLASEGVRFTHAYSSAPICTPTRVGMETGRYPARHPVGLMEPLRTGNPEHESMGLDTDQPTLTSLLSEGGYTNALFGKWHLGILPQFGPDKHGIDEFFGPLGGSIDHISHVNGAGRHDLYRNGEEVFMDGYFTDLVTDHAVDFIAERPDPFFLSLQYTSPHWPWQRRDDPPYEPGRPLTDDGPPEIYPEMLRMFDENVGRLMAAVDDAGIGDNTIVIFTSDNGGERYSNMAGLARGKGQVWEGGIRVPAFVRWPGVIRAGITTTQVAMGFDWTATILAAAQVAFAPTYPPDGIDLMPVMRGDSDLVERTLFWRTFQDLRQGAVRSGWWKYIRDEQGEYLFNLAMDPGERTNLRDQEADRFETLRGEYDAWGEQMLTPVPLLG